MNRKLLAGSALATLLVVPAASYITFRMMADQMAQYQAEETRKASPELKSNQPETALKKEKSDTGGELDVGRVASKPVTAEPKIADAKDAETAVLSEETPVSEVEDGLFRAEPERQRENGTLDNTIAGVPNPELAAPATTEGFVTAAEAPAIMRQDVDRKQMQAPSGDKFSSTEINPVKSVATEPVSTFSIDVDTASYAYMRQALTSGRLPEADSVRVEEMINYFPYDWKPPESADQAFKANITVMPTPWNEHTRLMHIGIKGYEVQQASQPAANLVFLLDVSGSMDEPAKLPLLKSAFRLLVGKLKPDDTVSIVVYAGASGVVLEPTKASEREKILAALDNLTPGGSTAGAEGLEAAYRLAKKAFVKDGVNRVLLATDGDFNVGPSSDEELKSIIAEKRKTGIFLSVLGFGTGNYNDALMQAIAQNGNGTAAYIDTLSEAQKTLVEEAGASLFPIAKDVKIQIEFNPAKIAEYRLIGYETRALKREDFNNDRIDAGEIGSGHRVTAIYEITPKGSPAMRNDDLRYGEADKPAEQPVAETTASDELAFVKIRHKKPDADKSELITMPVTEANAVASLDAASQDVRFSVAVAAFGQKLKGTNEVIDYGFDKIIDTAVAARGEDGFGYRAEFINLVRLAKGLKGE